MNARLAYSLNSQFGPPSEEIDVVKFIQDASQLQASTQVSLTLEETKESLAALAEECSVDDIRTSISDVWNDTRKSSYILKDHEITVNCLYGNSKAARPRKKNGNEFPSNTESQMEMQSKLENLKLSSWKIPSEASLFIRAPKNSDHNIYTEVRKTTDGETSLAEDSSPQALITYSVYNKLPWRSSLLSRSSQHCVVSSQTLGDLFEAIPCTSNELPAEKREDSRVVGYDANARMKGSHGAVICISGVAYGDGMSENDYAVKLLQHAQTFKSPMQLQKSPTTMHDTPLHSLSLKISEPYWLLHEGNCEHFVVIDSIRLKHTSDPPSGYPLTLRREPTTLETCAACAKAPAVWSIVGDVRLGESPCFLCAWCWTTMGESSDGSVVIVPLPKHELGW
ncbi:hypothetical protein V5O48_005692 [Marasmius crinis-equi]|uniref:snRNA-activating protein complex subunit 3 n=1 Tax=Marasmius crinis-equi TaxID=585013 RepID=A0ABR3FLL0_9AGAR